MRSAEERARREMARGNVDLALQVLDRRYAAIVCARFGIGEMPKTYAELGRRFGRSRERMRQLFVRAVTQLHRLQVTPEMLEQHAARTGVLADPPTSEERCA